MASTPQRVIIDTDPGVDDVSALLLALSAKAEELEVLLVSVTYGNVDVQSCLRNVVSVFHFIEKEQEWRRNQGRPEGFETLKANKPIIAIGASEPLGDQLMMADYFHGIDGLGGISHTHPHLTPPEAWKNLFTATSSTATSISPESITTTAIEQDAKTLFTPSNTPAHLEMLRLLRENPSDTITIIAVGPLTNCALAASADPETFLRAKEVVVMGGAIALPGNVTPAAEFNTFADAIAAARLFSLSSPNPFTTMPPIPPGPLSAGHLPPYPTPLTRLLKITILPLDITEAHMLHRLAFTAHLAPLLSSSPPSPLATWATAFMSSTFDKVASLHHSTPGLTMHDPLCVYYMLHHSNAAWASVTEDIRVETAGQWTRGMMVVDRRDRNRRLEEEGSAIAEVPGDSGNWLSSRAGNRVRRVTGSLGGERFEREFLGRVFGGWEGT